jgi:hypothetical protein
MRCLTCEIKIAKGGENLLLPSVIQTGRIFFCVSNRRVLKLIVLYILCDSYRAYSYNSYSNQQIHYTVLTGIKCFSTSLPTLHKVSCVCGVLYIL